MNEVKHIHLIGNPRSGMTITTEVISKIYSDAVYGPFRPCKDYQELVKVLDPESKTVIKSHIYDLEYFDNLKVVHNFKDDNFLNLLIIRKNMSESIISHAIARVTKQWGWDDYTRVASFSLERGMIESISKDHIYYLNTLLTNSYNIKIHKIFLNDSILDGVHKVHRYLLETNLINQELNFEGLTTKKAFDKRSVIDNYDAAERWAKETLDIKTDNLVIKDGIIESYRYDK